MIYLWPLPDCDYSLFISADYLGLQKNSDKKFNPFVIDFSSAVFSHRRSKAGLRSEFLARAIGVKPRDNPVILDATAGLGRDSFILATLGYQVIMLERSPIVFHLLQDALRRASENKETAAISARMKLFQANAIEWLSKCKPVDVIYLDPMFPERKKSALAKKDLQILQHIIGEDTDSEKCLALALTCATKRVVVKRPRLAPPIHGSLPSFSLTGTSSRFDIYTVQNL